MQNSSLKDSESDSNNKGIFYLYKKKYKQMANVFLVFQITCFYHKMDWCEY